MLWTVKRAARFLGVKPHQVYYLLNMGELESVKIGNALRLTPEGVKEYDKRFPEKPGRKFAGNFVYTGDGGFLFRPLPDRLPPDTRGKAARVEGRRGKLVRGAERPRAVLLAEREPVAQMELFTA